MPKIRNFEELEAKLSRYAQLKAKEAKLHKKADDRIRVITGKLDDDSAPVLGEMNLIHDEIEAFMRDQEGKRGIRSKKFAIATVSLVDQSKLVITDEARTVAKLLKKHPELVRVIQKPDREKLQKLCPKDLKSVGADIITTTILRIRFAKK